MPQEFIEIRGAREKFKGCRVAHPQWIIDMSPEGSSKGGQVMIEGTPKELLKAKGSITSEYLKR